MLSLYVLLLVSSLISGVVVAQQELFPLAQQQIIFLKSLDGEKFRTDLAPNLEKNVSYVLAIDVRNNPVSYGIKSKYFSVDSAGRVYLIAKLETIQNAPVDYQVVTVFASNGVEQTAVDSRITVLNANSQEPEFVTTQRVFEANEDMLYPVELAYRNGTSVLVHVYHPDPATIDLTVECESTVNYPRACELFAFRKDPAKSTPMDWIGTLLLTGKLSYLDQSVYQFYGVARSGGVALKRAVFEVRVTPNLNKPPKLSSASMLFTIAEKQPPNTLIGVLTLDEGYEKAYTESVSFSIITNLQELFGNGISLAETLDVNLNLVRSYVQIVNNNQLVSLVSFDRDASELTAMDGLLKLWVKVFYRSNQYIANFYKITIVVTDINDHAPAFGLVFNNTIGNSYSNLQTNAELMTMITENEIGPVYFDNLNRTLLDTRAIVVYDADLAENATFALTFVETNEVTPVKFSLRDLNSYFTFKPSALNVLGPGYTIESRSSLNIVNPKPIDFDDLKLPILIDPTGIGYKLIKFGLIANEVSSKESQSSVYLPIGLMVQDVNDNKPVFSQDTYMTSIAAIQNDPYNLQKVLAFYVYDKDSGIYGVKGLFCQLMGDGSDRFEVDSFQQAVFLRRCANGLPCSINDFKPIYYLTLVCRDNAGKGNVAFATVIVSFKEIYRSGFVLSNRIYYLLATGVNGVDVPKLTIKPLNLDPMNRIMFKIQDSAMAQLFSVDYTGTFKVIAARLSPADRRCINGTFLVPVSLTDLQGNINFVTVLVQLSGLINQNQCPRIADSALCQFTINQTSFDANRIRFCFYGASPPALNAFQNDTSPFSNQIFYSLLPDSPAYLYINAYDGCVKISQGFNFGDNSIKNIEYSVGVFNPGYPDCISVSQRACSITISNPKSQPPKCASDYTISPNSTTFRMQAYGLDQSSTISYAISREERLASDGSYQIVTRQADFFYRIDALSGLIEQVQPQYNCSSVLVVVLVTDARDPTSQTECSVEFRFTGSTLAASFSKFVDGASQTPVNICEDYPIGGLVTKLVAFDDSSSTCQCKALCFSLARNDYFKMASSIDPSPNGDVVLRRPVDLVQSWYNSMQRYDATIAFVTLNFTAMLYYCGQTTVLDMKVQQVNVYAVNKHAPQVSASDAAAKALISFKSGSSNFSTGSIGIVDADLAPFNAFKCSVENNDAFFVTNNLRERSISITYLPGKMQPPTGTFADLSVKCCDDQAYWSQNTCFSVPKCSLTPVRIQFIDYTAPVYCVNDQQVWFVPENAQVMSQIAGTVCISNSTQQPITYELVSKSGYYSVNPLTGQIFLAQPLINFGQTYQNLLVRCSSGQQSAQCQANLRIIQINDYHPIWISPNPSTVGSCINITESSPVNSVVFTVQATVPSQLLNKNYITYSFVYEGLLLAKLFEFEFRAGQPGKIFLRAALNYSANPIRELTLAATASKNGLGQYAMTTYQYFCIRILPACGFQPCFRDLPSGQRWYNQVNIPESRPSKCYYNQQVRVNNVWPEISPVYYYTLSNNYSTDTLYNSFTIDQNSGLVCTNLPDNELVKASIATSPFSYVDSFNYQCYNLLIFASTSQLSRRELRSIKYDASNCSFTFFKICINNCNCNYWPIIDDSYVCETSISLDAFSSTSAICLNKLRLKNQLEDKSFYDYAILPINNDLDPRIFFVNKSIDCLSIKSAAGTNRNSLLGLHEMNVTVVDRFGRFGSNKCSVYITQSCYQRAYVVTSSDLASVNASINIYRTYLSLISSNYMQRQIVVVVQSIYDYPSEYLSIDEFQRSNTIIVAAFYDKTNKRFLSTDELIGHLTDELASNTARQLNIEQIISSCPVLIGESIVAQSIILALWCLFLLALFIIAPLIVICLLCFLFKKLKYQNNRIIMKEKVIPIMQLQDGECCEPIECAPVECDPCGPMSPMASRMGTLMRGSLQPQRIRHAATCADDYLDEIVEEDQMPSGPGNDPAAFNKAFEASRDMDTVTKKPPGGKPIFHVEPLNITSPNQQATMGTMDSGSTSTSRFRAVVPREPIKTAFGTSERTRDQLYETVNAHATRTPQHHHGGKGGKASKHAGQNQSSSLLRHVTSIDKISSANNLDPAMLMEPIGESAIVSLNGDSNAFYYDDSPPSQPPHGAYYQQTSKGDVKRRRGDVSESFM